MTATEPGQRATKRKRDSAAAEPAPCHVTLPDHLVAEVLARLPARSLARLRCACRSWDAEISSPTFQERHRAVAAAKLAFLRPAPPHIACLQVKRGSRRPAEWLSSCNCPAVVGSKPCENAFSVCNPTTREVLHLPPSHQKRSATGIGFHAPAGEFKVVTVGIDLGNNKLQARVLTVGDAQGWRSPADAAAGEFSDDDRIDTDVAPVFADGCIHWSFFRAEHVDKPHGVLSFSLAGESFRRVAQPPFAAADLVPYDINGAEQQHEYRLWLRHARGVRSSEMSGGVPPVGTALAELDGRLCVMRDVRHCGDVGGVLFEIWMLQDYEAGRWTLDYRVDLAPELVAERERLTTPWLVVPLSGGSQRAKRKLLLATTAREAHVYDPDDGTLRTVASVAGGGDDSKSEDNSLRLVLYQENLVRFTGMKQAKDEIEFVKLEYESSCTN